MSVLVVCHGNICRSPLAAAVMRKAGLTDVVAAGFKPEGQNGKRSPKKMRVWAESAGYDLSEHRSQALTREMLLEADIVLYMDGGQLQRLEAAWEDWDMRSVRGPMDPLVRPLGAWLEPAAARIADPNFQRPETSEFITIMHQLVEAGMRFAQYWQAKHPVTAGPEPEAAAPAEVEASAEVVEGAIDTPTAETSSAEVVA